MAEEYFILDSESTSSVDPTINPPVSVDTLRIGSNSQELKVKIESLQDPLESSNLINEDNSITMTLQVVYRSDK